MVDILQAKEAGKELAKAVDLAYQTNQDSEFTIHVECKTEADVTWTVNEILLTAKLEEIGEIIPRKALFLVRASLGSVFNVSFPYRPESYSLNTEWNNSSVLKMDFVIHGASTDFRWQYEYNDYTKQNLRDVLYRVEGLNELQKSWEVASWVVEKIGMKLDVVSDDVYVTPQTIYYGSVAGDDETLAEAFLFFASLVGVDTDHYLSLKQGKDNKKPFFLNALKIEGKDYYLDMVAMNKFDEECVKRNASICSSRCCLIPDDEMKGLEEYQVGVPYWKSHLPFSFVSPV